MINGRERERRIERAGGQADGGARDRHIGTNLDAQNEAPSGVFGLKEVEEGSPRATDVQSSGWRGGEPHPHIFTRSLKNRSSVFDDVFHERAHTWYAALLGVLGRRHG